MISNNAFEKCSVLFLNDSGPDFRINLSSFPSENPSETKPWMQFYIMRYDHVQNLHYALRSTIALYRPKFSEIFGIYKTKM